MSISCKKKTLNTELLFNLFYKEIKFFIKVAQLSPLII